MYRETEQNEVNITLWDESACTHVRVHDHGYRGRLLWDTFETYTEAVKAYEKAINFFHKGTSRTTTKVVNSHGNYTGETVTCKQFNDENFYLNANTRLTLQ